MRKIFLLVSFSTLVNFSFSQERVFKNSIQVNTLPLPFKSFNLFYQRALSANHTAGIALNYYMSDRTFFKYYDSRWYAVTIDYRYFFADYTNGIFINPYLKYRYIVDFGVANYLPDPLGLNAIERPVQDEHWHYLGAGATLGYQYIFKKGFTFAPFAGGGYFPWAILKAENPNITQNKPLRPDFRIGLNIGWSF
jgi:hypothetical protein